MEKKSKIITRLFLAHREVGDGVPAVPRQVRPGLEPGHLRTHEQTGDHFTHPIIMRFNNFGINLAFIEFFYQPNSNIILLGRNFINILDNNSSFYTTEMQIQIFPYAP